MREKVKGSSLFNQIEPVVDLMSFFKNNIIALGLVDTTGCIVHCNPLFTKHTGIASTLVHQRLSHFELFNHVSFHAPFEKMVKSEITEFMVARSVKNEIGKRCSFEIKCLRVDQEEHGKAFLIWIEDVTSDSNLEEVIQNIGVCLERSTESNFFDSMCSSLSESLDIGIVVIGAYDKATETISSLSFLKDAKFVQPLDYAIRGTTAELIRDTKKIVVYETDVQEGFPYDEGLKELKANSFIGYPLLDSQGEFVGYISLMDKHKIINFPVVQSVLRIYSHTLGREIERKKQEERINAQTEIYKAIYDKCPFGIVSSDDEGYLQVNYQFAKMLGYTIEELSKMKRDDITHPDDVNVHNEKSEKKRGLVVFNKRYIKKDGTTCHTSVSLSIINNDANYLNNNTSDIAKKFIIVKDRSYKIDTERALKESREQLNQNLVELDKKNKELKKYIDSNLQLENFAHIASHDLKEPLRSIGNFSQLLAKKLENRLTDSEREFFEFILDGVRNMNQLIEDLLMYSSINNSNVGKEKLDFNEVLINVNRSLDQSVLENNAEIIINQLPNYHEGSKTKMKQLFQNLISNALKFKKPDIDPMVTIDCKDIGKYLQFSVKDNGIGIQKEYTNKIFLIFKRLHSKSEYQGTGIGLAVCKKIVEQHGGEIWVESEYGEGTTFFFTLLKN